MEDIGITKGEWCGDNQNILYLWNRIGRSSYRLTRATRSPFRFLQGRDKLIREK